jgi:pilus assembly protein CpaE
VALAHDITLLIADDSEEMRETLKTLLTFNEKIKVVGEASDGKEAYTKVEMLKPDLVLMDINMGEVGVSDGIWATQEISLRFPQTGIIIISVQDESDYMRRAMSAGARDYLVKPFDSDELFKTIESVVERERAKWENIPAAQVAPVVRPHGTAQTYTVFSAKGGVGKSVIAANVAVDVRKRTGKRVLIVDLDLQFGDIALLLNVSPKSTIAHVAESGADMIDAEYMETHISDSASGVRVLAAPLKPEYAEVVTAEVIQKVLEVVRTQYDYVFIDTVPSFGPEVLGAFDHSDGILLIVSPDFLALKNVTLGLAVLDTLNYPPNKIHLILNRTQPLASVKLKDVERGLQRKVAVEIPSDGDLVVGSVNRGQPLIISHPTSPVSKAISQIADLIIGDEGDDSEASHTRGLLSNLFGKR